MSATIIPIVSESDILIVAVSGKVDDNLHRGWRHVLDNFFYECQANENFRFRRAANRFIAFYLSSAPMAIVYWATVEKITEKDGYRRYHLKSITKLNNYIVKGKTLPLFSGGGVSIPLEIFFKIKNLDEIYEKYRQID
jgi:hypothetical protein